MPESNDQVVEQARDRMREQIEKCAGRAAQKIAEKVRTGKISTDALAKLIAVEFEELNL